MVKRIETQEHLTNWEDYKDFLKQNLKRVKDVDDVFFVSKDKVEFTVGGRPWSGYAVLAGPTAVLATKKLKAAGIKFREGVCKRAGRNLEIGGMDSRFLRGAKKTFTKLKLPYRILDMPETAAT